MFSGLDHACARSRFGGFGWVFAMCRRGTAVPPTDSFILFWSWSLCRLYSLPLSSMGLNSMVRMWGRIMYCNARRKFYLSCRTVCTVHVAIVWGMSLLLRECIVV